MKLENLLFSFSRRKTFSVFLSLFIGVFFLFSNIQFVSAANQSNLNNSDTSVIEYLRISVSAKDKKAWLIAEENSWKNWLKEQKGFLGRELLWDPGREEALLLIRWASRKDWKSIPQSEIDNVQERFEEIAKESTGKRIGNPFPIQSQGELLPQ